MPQKSKSPLYKHAELIAGQPFPNQKAIDGFAVVLKDPLYDHELLKKHFRSDFLAFFLINRGQVTFQSNFQQYTAHKNNLVIMAPNAIKQLVDFRKGSTITGISFTASFLGKIGMPHDITQLLDYFSTRFSPLWKLNDHDAALIVQLVTQLYHRCDRFHTHLYGKELLYHSLYTFHYEIAALGQKYAEPHPLRVSRKENLVIHFTNLVQKQCRLRRNVQEYAKELCITPKYLTETVKEITGKPAGEIIDDFVLQEAKLLLEDPSLSIAEIANELHFSDQSFFGKFFKRHTGLSPREYRNKG